MSQGRYCAMCGTDVRPREERQPIPGAHGARLRLTCPNCSRVLADIYDSALEIKPVSNAKISRG